MTDMRICDYVAAIFSSPLTAEQAIRAIEAGEIEPTIDDVETIAGIVPLDPQIAADLLRTGEAAACRVCGCSWNDACHSEKDGSCWWVADDLCSHCPTPKVAA